MLFGTWRWGIDEDGGSVPGRVPTGMEVGGADARAMLLKPLVDGGGRESREELDLPLPFVTFSDPSEIRRLWLGCKR